MSTAVSSPTLARHRVPVDAYGSSLLVVQGAARIARVQARFVTSFVHLKPGLKPFACVFLPFALGYYLSYLFRVINAVLAGPLIQEFELNATQLGLLTSAYFLTFALAQLPLGIALDRFGPHKVQGALLLVATMGALVFASSSDFGGLVAGRALIGLGVAGTLIAGLKVVAASTPPRLLPLANGAFIALGTAGAVTATLPLEAVLAWLPWRHLFFALACCTAIAAVMMLLMRQPRMPTATGRQMLAGLRTIYTDRRFWRLAPLSCVCIGSALAMQSLWAAPWLADVAQLDRNQIAHHLFVMSLALCASAFLLGLAGTAAKRKGVCPGFVFAATAGVVVAAQMLLMVGVSLPYIILWCVIAAMGGGTALAFSALAGLFPSELAGRANSALNVMNIGGACAIQAAIGVILDFWPQDHLGRYPAIAYQCAFLAMIIMQALAIAWFACPRRR